MFDNLPTDHVSRNDHDAANDAFMAQIEKMLGNTLLTAGMLTQIAWVLADNNDAKHALEIMVRYWEQ